MAIIGEEFMKKKNVIIAVVLSASMVIGQGSMIFAEQNRKNATNENVNEKAESAQELLKGKNYVKGELLVSYDDKLSNGKIRNAVKYNDEKCKDIFEANKEEKTAVVKISNMTEELSLCSQTMFTRLKKANHQMTATIQILTVDFISIL